MGMVFGKIAVETPKYEVLHRAADYEIRKYFPSVLAQVTYGDGDRDSGFTILANYIGALGSPKNSKPEEKIAMTAPVMTTSGGGEEQSKSITMQFVLPAGKYTRTEEAPKPTDERVVIREEGERKYGVLRFSGVATDKVVEEKVEKLRGSLERDGHKVVGEFLLARFNPPWTLPPFRTNEVMLPIQ